MDRSPPAGGSSTVPCIDLGPHLLDLVEAALGPIEAIDRHGDPTGWLELTCVHRAGAISQLSLSGAVGCLSARGPGVELYGRAGVLEIDFGTVDHAECWPVLRAEFARGRAHRHAAPTRRRARRTPAAPAGER